MNVLTLCKTKHIIIYNVFYRIGDELIPMKRGGKSLMEEEYLARRDAAFQVSLEHPMPEYLRNKAIGWKVPFTLKIGAERIQKILGHKITVEKLSGAFSDTLYVPFSTVLVMEGTLILVPDFTLEESNIEWLEEMASSAFQLFPEGIALKWNSFYQGLWIYNQGKIENLRAKASESM